MRILYHHRTLADGAEGIHIQEMVDAFRSLGHTVDVVSLATPRARGQGHEGVLTFVRNLIPNVLYELLSMLYNAAEYWRFRRLLARDKPDLIYKRHALYDLGILAAAKAEGIPVVLEINRPYSSETYHHFE